MSKRASATEILFVILTAFILASIGTAIAHKLGYKSSYDKEIESCQPYENLPLDKLPAKCVELFK